MPSTLANSVSSEPRPTLRPGLKRVPRWRTRMEPPVTHCPPKRLTPSICGFESRPLRELPTPFLCAMTCLHLDLEDLHRGRLLAMTAVPAVVLPPLELDDQDLAPAALGHDLARHARALEPVRPDDDLAVPGHQQHGGEGHLGALVAGQLLHGDDLALGHPVLLAPRCDDGFHSPTTPHARLSDGRS